MKKIPKYIFLLLAMIGYISIQAQDISNPAMNSTDLKLSRENSGNGSTLSVNPAKPITPSNDPKLKLESKSEMQEISSPVQKSPTHPLLDPKIEAENASVQPNEVIPVIRTESKAAMSTSKESDKQPAGIVPKSNTSYRNIKGADSQPAGAKSEKETNFRIMNGPNTQPAAEKPKR
jgi:hypothetical protein